MSTTADVYANCDWCGAAIRRGGVAVTVTRNIEQADAADPPADASVTVVDSKVALTLCAQCGNRFDLDSLHAILRSGVTRS